jgi:hypothetical protein
MESRNANRETEAKLLAELKEAERAYRAYCAEYRAGGALREDLPSENPDGRYAFRKSLEAYNALLRNYSDALRRWSEFIVEQRLPRETRKEP